MDATPATTQRTSILNQDYWNQIYFRFCLIDGVTSYISNAITSDVLILILYVQSAWIFYSNNVLRSARKVSCNER